MQRSYLDYSRAMEFRHISVFGLDLGRLTSCAAEVCVPLTGGPGSRAQDFPREVIRGIRAQLVSFSVASGRQGIFLTSLLLLSRDCVKT